MFIKFTSLWLAFQKVGKYTFFMVLRLEHQNSAKCATLSLQIIVNKIL